MLCETTLEDSDLDYSDLDGVILVGGSTRIPLVKQSIEVVFNLPLITTFNVDEVIALGAAVYADSLQKRRTLLNRKRQHLQNSLFRKSLSRTTARLRELAHQKVQSLLTQLLSRKTSRSRVSGVNHSIPELPIKKRSTAVSQNLSMKRKIWNL